MATQENSSSAITDEEILRLLAAESSYQRGFNLLVKTYQERLYWHIRGMVGNHDDADEVLQNSFIKVYKGIASFKENSKLYTWLYRIATNAAITFINKRKKRQTADLDDEESGLANRLKADSYIDSKDINRLLQAALQSLPDKQKQVFLLRYYDEMTYKEMAEILETSVGGLKANYHHAAKKIEEFVKARM